MEFRYKVSQFYRLTIPAVSPPLLSVFHFTPIYYDLHFKHPIRHRIEIVKTHVGVCILHEWHSRLNICSEIFALAGKERERSRKVSYRRGGGKTEREDLFHLKKHVNKTFFSPT